MENIALSLCTGRPEDGSRTTGSDENEHSATFSRFVLPFAYSIERITDANRLPDLHYIPNSLQNLSFVKRRKYFSRETALTLYERSIWLDMSVEWEQTPWGKEEIQVTLRDRRFKLGMLPPRIVLFEAGNAATSEDRLATLSEQDGHVLHSGFLLVDIYFPEQQEHPELDDLLQLNEFFRFFAMPFDDHAKRFKERFGELPAQYTTGENFDKVQNQRKLERYFERWANLLELPIRDGEKYYRLFPGEWAENVRKLCYDDNQTDRDNNWLVYVDNRCFVWTAAFLEKGGKTLRKHFNPGKSQLVARDYGHWIKLLNVDPPLESAEKTHGSVTNFERDWADKRTYKRWEAGGTWYGFCYHSGVVLGEPEKYIFSPYSSYYFDATLLLFYIRITLFGFSRELTQLFHKGNHDTNTWRLSLRAIRRQFSKFTILYQFPLLSNQQQLIEMFELNRRYFDIDNFFQEIQREIDNTHDFLELVEANKLSVAANWLAKWGIPLAVGGLVSSIFGMDNVHLTRLADSSCRFDFDRIIETILVVAATVGTYFLVRFLMPKDAGDKK